MSVKAAEMSFLDHLEELRWRVVKSAVAIAICAIPCGIYWKKILDLIMIYPLRFANPRPQIIYTNPSEAVILSLKIAVAGGLILAAPVVFYQLWKFISPGLYHTEKRLVLPTVVVSTISFLSGISFSYLMLPLVLKFLTGFAGDKLVPFYRADEYLGFLLKISLSFGLVFELPVVSFVLSRMGIINARFLLRNFKYAFILIFIVAAILTPPDILSQTVLALPLILLYGISIIVAHVAGRNVS